MTDKERFDQVMRGVLTVSKAEMQRRIEEDKQERDIDPNARLKAAEKRPTRSPEL
jgi:hypothetical protein